jgi:hypothetical protein
MRDVMPPPVFLPTYLLLGSRWSVRQLASSLTSPPAQQSACPPPLVSRIVCYDYAPFARGYAQYGSLSEGCVANLHAWHTWHGRGAGEASGKEPLSGVPWAFSRPKTWPHRLAAGQHSVIVTLCNHSCPAPIRAR